MQPKQQYHTPGHQQGNILLGLNAEIRLVDFGPSVHNQENKRTTMCGMVDYLPLGEVLVFELLTGRPPFESKSFQTTEKSIANFKGKVSILWSVLKEGRGCIHKLVHAKANKHISLGEVLKHP
ncbi:hypothetical protein GQ43DRAFT_423222 [Delitschia confertaspora ATCC 74209]|uniref:Protein kinase domain-containing protein n=1 Tax=Delitschia confertaspora ATCC 74209 TaxID=1513339 RepID=A0A9P4JGZ5_9PLEO|nr:hypothetical protein GQ43DRAFT_423222 [Delitschia confertaspora ATCC 74209]